MKISKIKSYVFGIAFLGSIGFLSSVSVAQVVGGPGGEGGFECKTESIRCNWYNSDVRLICHQNGDGISCNCGESTTCS